MLVVICRYSSSTHCIGVEESEGRSHGGVGKSFYAIFTLFRVLKLPILIQNSVILQTGTNLSQKVSDVITGSRFIDRLQSEETRSGSRLMELHERSARHPLRPCFQHCQLQPEDEDACSHLSHGVSLISDLAHNSGILQSDLFTSRSQNLVLAKLPNSGFWRYGQFFK